MTLVFHCVCVCVLQEIMILISQQCKLHEHFLTWTMKQTRHSSVTRFTAAAILISHLKPGAASSVWCHEPFLVQMFSLTSRKLQGLKRLKLQASIREHETNEEEPKPANPPKVKSHVTHTDASWKITCNALFEWSEAEELVSAAGCSHSHWCSQLVKLTNAGKKFLSLDKFSLETLQMWRRKVPRAVSALGQEAVTWTQQGDEGRTEPELIKYNYDDQRWRAGRGWDLGHHEKSAGLNVRSQRQKLKW